MYQIDAIKQTLHRRFYDRILIPIDCTVAKIGNFIGESIDTYYSKFLKDNSGNNLPAKLQSLFLDVVKDTLKKCSGILNYNSEGDEFNNFIFYYETDKTPKCIGCMDDRGFLLVDSKFIYKQMEIAWKKHNNEKPGKLPALPDYKNFYKALYNDNILNKGYFFRHPLYKLSLSLDEFKEWYFCISKETICYDDTTINWCDC